MAPDCIIRHPVRPIVALQRRMRFSARLAGFCRDRCHQRRARRAERASFSAFVSNPDFRVPRLRQIGWRAANRAVRRRKRGHPRGPRIEARVTAAYRASTFWSRCGPGLLDAYLSPGLDPGLRSGGVVSRCCTTMRFAPWPPARPIPPATLERTTTPIACAVALGSASTSS